MSFLKNLSLLKNIAGGVSVSKHSEKYAFFGWVSCDNLNYVILSRIGPSAADKVYSHR